MPGPVPARAQPSRCIVNGRSRFRHVAIRASAGSGKTYKLTNRYIALLLAGESPERILATTFTRKAAGEILERVLTRLSEAVVSDDARGKLADALGAQQLPYEHLEQVLLSTTRVLHRVNISTIDAFFAGIAKAFSLELGFPPQWDIVETSVYEAMRAEAVNMTLRGEVGAVVTLIRLLSRQSGERSVASLVRETVEELYDVFLDAPERAWRALEPLSDPDPLWCEELVRQLEDAVLSSGQVSKDLLGPLLQNVEDARLGRWHRMLSRGPARKVLEGSHEYRRAQIPPEIDDHLCGLVDEARAILAKMLIDRGLAAQSLLTRFDEHFQELKRTRAALRFDDVTRALSTASLLGELDDVFFRLDGRIHHLLLDEFQDTSLSQWQVLRPLSREVASHATGDRSVLLVGDVKQAIYGWRGGVADIFDSLDGDLPGLTWRPLNKSYRSSTVIVSLVNYVFDNTPGNAVLSDDQAAATTWQKSFKRHGTAKPELPGYARLEVGPAPGDTSGRWAVAHRAAEITQELSRQCPAATIGVLTRTNDGVRRVISELRRLGVEASEEGGNPITDAASVSLILSLMRMADHPADAASRFHVAHSPLGQKLGLTDDPWSAVRVASQVRRELIREGYGACVLRWSETLAPSCDDREARRLGQLVRLAHRHDDAPTLRPKDFVVFAESERVEDPTADNVRVMTIHKAKGLEFDIVVLPDLDTKLVGHRPAVLVDSPSPTSPPTRVVPYANEQEQQAIPELADMVAVWRAGQVRESLSLLYVALTRAIHALYMIVEPPRQGWGRPKTHAGVLCAALAPSRDPLPGDVLFFDGDEQWYLQCDFRRPDTSEPPRRVDAIGMKPCPVRRRGLPRTSPSALEGGTTVQLADLLRLDTGALRRGSVIHALFEQISWLEDGIPAPEQLETVARNVGASVESAGAFIAEFFEMVRRTEVARVLSRDRYRAPDLRVDVYRELPFAYAHDDRIMTGAMDRVVVRSLGDVVRDVEVLDYKTDALDESTLSGRVEHYRPQLDAYREAAARVFCVEVGRVRATLVFVQRGIVVDVTTES